MGEMMEFPQTWGEYEESYGFTDSKKVYTNGSRLIQSFRVEQWLEHIGAIRHNALVESNFSPKQYQVDLQNAYDCGYEKGKADAEPQWIPVEQELPKEKYLDDGYVEPSQPVLVYMSCHTCKVSRYWGHRKSKGTSDYVIPDWMDLEEYDSDNVLAWMTLPELYEGVNE